MPVVQGHEEDLATHVDGPALSDMDELALAPAPAAPARGRYDAFEFAEEDDFQEISEEDDETTARRPLPASAGDGKAHGRLSGVVLEIFKRKRAQIGLSFEQLSKVSGIKVDELQAMERGRPDYRLSYDHAVVLAKALGVRPAEMPGLRPRPQKEGERGRLDEVRAWLASVPQLVFEGRSGERFGGDVERAGVTPAVCVKIGDGSLGEVHPAGTLLGFVSLGNQAPREGQVLLLRHRRSKLLAMRRLGAGGALSGLVPWQPGYTMAAGEWLPIGRLALVLPPG